MRQRCEYAGCRKLIDTSSIYCTEHKQQRERDYNKQVRKNKAVTSNGHTNEEVADFYQSKEWKHVRLIALARDNYICQPCLKQGVVHPANLVHHIIELRSPNGWEHRLDLDNLEAINRACHNTEKHYHSNKNK